MAEPIRKSPHSHGVKDRGRDFHGVKECRPFKNDKWMQEMCWAWPWQLYNNSITTTTFTTTTTTFTTTTTNRCKRCVRRNQLENYTTIQKQLQQQQQKLKLLLQQQLQQQHLQLQLEWQIDGRDVFSMTNSSIGHQDRVTLWYRIECWTLTGQCSTIHPAFETTKIDFGTFSLILQNT